MSLYAAVIAAVMHTHCPRSTPPAADHADGDDVDDNGRMSDTATATTKTINAQGTLTEQQQRLQRRMAELQVTLGTQISAPRFAAVHALLAPHDDASSINNLTAGNGTLDTSSQAYLAHLFVFPHV